MKRKLCKVISGIYLIINSINGKLYVGSATNIPKRWDWHKRALEIKKHHSILLQRSYELHGSEAFHFCIVEECKIDDLLNIEQLWMDASNCYDPEFGYNIYRIAGSGRGHKHSKEALIKLSIASTGRKWSDATKNKASIIQKNRSPEWRANHSAAMKKRVFTEEHRKKLKEANKKRGNSYVTDKMREKMSESQKKRVIKQGYIIKPQWRLKK